MSSLLSKSVISKT